MMNTKSSNYGNYGNSVFSTMTSSLWDQNITIPTSVDYLPYPHTVENFYETFKMVVTDTYDNAIRIKKDGYLNITLKALINNAGSDLDIQVSKLNDPTVVVRQSIRNMGYVEINFETEVSVNDEIAIAMRSELGGASLMYIAGDAFMVAHEAYVMNLHFVENNDEIGNMFFSVDPNIEDMGYAIKLDTERDLVKDSYLKLYAKLQGTAFMKSETATNFTIVDFSQNPYLRAGAGLAVVAQNLPDPQITADVSGSTDQADDLGSFHCSGNGGEEGIQVYVSEPGCFSISGSKQIMDYAGQSTNFHEDMVTLNMPPLPFTTAISNSVASNGSYSTTDPNVKPKSSQMYLYMYCDRQITGVRK